MTQFAFGSGTVIGRRTDVANTAPAFIGVVQDIQIDFDRTIKELLGQNQMAVALAASQLKITGKAKFGRIQATTMNNLFFGQTLASASGIALAAAENHAVPGTPFQVVVTNGATYVQDLGVFYHATGVQLQPVASGPATGQYVAGAVGVGQYLFATGDTGVAGGVDIYYRYTVSSQQQITLVNPLAGTTLPVFELTAQEQFVYFGTTKTIVLVLNACVSSKLSWPFKNQDFLIQEMDLQVQADASGNIGTLTLTE